MTDKVKIKMKTRACGPLLNAVPGDVRLVDAALGKSLVDDGCAVYIEIPDIEKSQPAPPKKRKKS